MQIFIQRHAFLPLIANELCHVRFRDGKKTLKTRVIAYASHLDHRIFSIMRCNGASYMTVVP